MAVLDPEELNEKENDGSGVYDFSPTEPSPAPGGKKQKGSSPQDLNSSESAGGNGSVLNRGYTGPGSFRDFVVQGKLTRKRLAIGAGLISVMVAIAVIFTNLSGPLQFITLASVLERNFANSDHTSHLRITRLFRFAKTGNFGETRVGLVGSKLFGNYIDQLKSVGIEFKTTDLDYMKSMTVDTSLLQEKFPELKNLSAQEQKDYLAKNVFKSLDASQFQQTSGASSDVTGGFKFSVNTRDFGIGATRALVNDTASSLESGKAISWLMTHSAKDYYNIPALWDPINRLTAGAAKKLSVAQARKAAQQEQEDRAKALNAPASTPEVTDARAKIKGAIQDNEGKIASFLIAQAGLCTVRGIADHAITLNRGAIVLPAAFQAADKISFGEALKNGSTQVDPAQLEVASQSLVNDKNQSIWGAKSMQALEGKTNPQGLDLPTEYAQAFSDTTTADGIKNKLKITIAGHDATGIACSKIGLVVGGAAGIVALVAGIPSDGGSWAGYAALKAGELAATTAVIDLLVHEITPIVKDQAIVPQVLSGPLGGNLLAYGSRALGNIQATTSGGAPMPGTSSSVETPTVQALENQQYSSQSTFAKLFDAHDYRSLAGRIIDNTSPSITQNIAKMASAITHFGSIFSNLGNIFSPKASADTPYNWGFDQVGIPDSVAADPRFDDPYANADQVAKLIENTGGTTSPYVKRAASCFGVTITNQDSDNVWEVVPKITPGSNNDINPGSSDYTEANCGENSDNWHRLQLFVWDSRTMDAAACDLGDDTVQMISDSCANIGYTYTGTSSTLPPSNGVSNTGSYYQNPFRDIKNLQINRIDEGADYNGNGTVYAIGNAKITALTTTDPKWPGGVFINYQLTDGPAAGKNIYMAEDCVPQVKIGQTVTPNTVICAMTGGPDGVETGWAQNATSYAAAAIDVYHEGDATAYGKNFSDFLKSFGGPPGDISKSKSPNLVGALPSGWPTWQ